MMGSSVACPRFESASALRICCCGPVATMVEGATPGRDLPSINFARDALMAAAPPVLEGMHGFIRVHSRTLAANRGDAPMISLARPRWPPSARTSCRAGRAGSFFTMGNAGREAATGFDPDIFGLPFSRARTFFTSIEPVTTQDGFPEKIPEQVRGTVLQPRGGDYEHRLGVGTLIATGCVDPVTRRWKEIPGHVWNDGLVNIVDPQRGTLLIGYQIFERARVRDPVGLSVRDAVRTYGNPRHRAELAILERLGQTPGDPAKPGDRSRQIQLKDLLIADLCKKLNGGYLIGSAVKRIIDVESRIRRRIAAADWERAAIDLETGCVRIDGFELHDIRVYQPAPDAFIRSVVTRGLAPSALGYAPAADASHFGAEPTESEPQPDGSDSISATEVGRPISSEATGRCTATTRAIDESGVDCPVTREQFIDARDPLPPLVQWAQWKYAAGKLPGRKQLLDDHRMQFGQIFGISELTMRSLRGELASEAAKRGGAPTHHIWQGRLRARLPGKLS
jgi:hypothetical protein